MKTRIVHAVFIPEPGIPGLPREPGHITGKAASTLMV
jgi:hypothetical protein